MRHKVFHSFRRTIVKRFQYRNFKVWIYSCHGKYDRRNFEWEIRPLNNITLALAWGTKVIIDPTSNMRKGSEKQAKYAIDGMWNKPVSRSLI